MSDTPVTPGRLDARGRGIPGVLIFLAKSVRYISRGTRVVVEVDDEETVAELAAWASWVGHEVESPSPAESIGLQGRAVVLAIRTGSDRVSGRKSRPLLPR